MAKNRVRATPKQMKAVDNIVSGRFRSTAAAMRDAGYSSVSATHPAHVLMNSRGVEAYLTMLDEKSQRKYNLNLGDKIMEGYLEGLEATKPLKLGQRVVEIPDWMTRKQFLDRFAEFFGWIQIQKRNQSVRT